MKKTMIFAAALLSLCLTACGTEPATDTEDSAVTSVTTEAVTTEENAETTAEEAETTAEEAEETTAAETEESAETTTTAAETEDSKADTKEQEEAAVKAMQNLNKLNGWMAGGAGLQTDTEDAPIKDEQTGEVQFAKITDADAPKTVAEVEELIGKTTAGTLKDNLLDCCGKAFKEQDGALYVDVQNAHGYHKFEVADGVTLSEVTEKSFTATAKGTNEVDGRGLATFVKDGDNWVIDSYEFGDF